MNNILYKGVIVLTTEDGKHKVMCNSGTNFLGNIVCKALIPGEKIDDTEKPYKINLLSGGRNCFTRPVPITGAIYGNAEELPPAIKNIVVSESADKKVTLSDVTLGFVRFISSLVRDTGEDRFFSTTPTNLKLSMYNYVNNELAYIEEDSEKTLATVYNEIKNGKEVMVDWFMLIVNGQVE